jgi:hypothetical protein
MDGSGFLRRRDPYLTYSKDKVVITVISRDIFIFTTPVIFKLFHTVPQDLGVVKRGQRTCFQDMRSAEACDYSNIYIYIYICVLGWIT